VTAGRLPVLSALAALVLGAAACSSGPSSPRSAHPAVGASAEARVGPHGVQHITITATDRFRFDPSRVIAHPGRLTVTLVDAGSYPHNLSVAGLHTTSNTVTGGLGRTHTTFTLRFAHAGTYTFVCTFHSSAGMRGQFVIR
jgi:plastocyanin